MVPAQLDSKWHLDGIVLIARSYSPTALALTIKSKAKDNRNCRGPAAGVHRAVPALSTAPFVLSEPAHSPLVPLDTAALAAEHLFSK